MLTEASRIIFPEQLKACLETYTFDDSPSRENEIIIKTLFSAISWGSELVAFTNDHDMGVMPYSIKEGEPYAAWPSIATTIQR